MKLLLKKYRVYVKMSISKHEGEKTMKQTEKGVSMVSLVITIIVIIILAAVAFSGSQETIGRAGFAGYTTDLDSVRTAFITEGITNLMGEQTSKNNAVINAQAYNFLAKGATTNKLTDDEKKHAWLSKSQASAIPCTRIEKEWAKEAIGIELPVRTVNTYGASGVEIEYFVTNDGIIFTWPPFYRSDDGLFYINDTMTVKGSKLTSGDWIISGDDESKMYEDGFKFIVGDVEIKTLATGEELPEISSDATPEELRNMASVAYKDERNPEEPKGIESEKVYQDNGVISGSEDEDGEAGRNESEEEKTLITFTFVGVNNEVSIVYTAEEGMTWREFIESSYNNGDFSMEVTYPQWIRHKFNRTYALIVDSPDDVINKNGKYKLTSDHVGGSND